MINGLQKMGNRVQTSNLIAPNPAKLRQVRKANGHAKWRLTIKSGSFSEYVQTPNATNKQLSITFFNWYPLLDQPWFISSPFFGGISVLGNTHTHIYMYIHNYIYNYIYIYIHIAKFDSNVCIFEKKCNIQYV